MADAPSWDDVKRLLDDPDVPDDQKAELAKNFEAYDDQWSMFGTEDRVQPYLDRYGGGYWNTQGRQSVDALADLNPFSGASWSEGGHAKQYLIDSYHKARQSADQAGKDNRQHNADVANGRHQLEDARTRAAGGGTGVGTSDELLDAGRPGLRYFDRFLPLYGRLPGTVRKNPPPGVAMTADFLHRRYEEHRGINFTHFATDADEMTSGATTERNEHQEMSNKLSALWNHWTGPASRSSQESFGDFAQHVEKIIQALDDTAQISRLAMHNISDAVRGKAQWLLDNDRNSDTYDGKGPGQIDVIIKCASGAASDDELKQACGYVGVDLDDGACDDETYRSRVPPAAIRWLNGFAADMDGRVGAFVKTCDSTRSRVDDAFRSLTDQLGKITGDPFVTRPGGGDSGGHTDPSGAGGRGGHGPGGGHHGPSGGDAGPGVGGVPGARSVPGGGSLPGSGGGPPGAGGVPGSAAPTGVPRPPGTVPAGYAPPAASPQEAVTIRDGRNNIAVARPDGQGNVRLTVDTGNGQLKTYDLDFGGNPASGSPSGRPAGPLPGAPAGPGQPDRFGPAQPGNLPTGQPGVPGQSGPLGPGQPGAPPAGGTHPGTAQPGASYQGLTQPGQTGGTGPSGPAAAGQFGSGAPGQFGPGHAAPFPPDPAQVGPAAVQAGPDGLAVVHDGPLTITAEHPGGAPDQLRITVDDGHGRPAAYTVDFPGQPGGVPGQPVAGPAGGTPMAPWGADAPQPAGIPDASRGAGYQQLDPVGGGAPYPATPYPVPQYPAAQAPADPYSPAQAPAGPYPPGQAVGYPGDGYPGGSEVAAAAAGGAVPAGPMSTTAASAGFGHPDAGSGSAGSLWGSGGGDAPGAGADPGDIWGGQGGDHQHPGLADTSAPQAGDAGGAGLAAMPDGGSGHGQQGPAPAAGGAMMPMMGGMGAVAGGHGGDQERAGSQWRTQGRLFDDVTDGRAGRGVLGEDDGR
jgi:uncharacterized protein YukE